MIRSTHINRRRQPIIEIGLVDAVRTQLVVAGDDELAAQIAAVCIIRTYAPGEELIRQGAVDNHIALLLRGRVAVVVDGREVAQRHAGEHVGEVAQRHAGEHVGEVALLNPAMRRTASVIALDETVAAWVGEPEFSAIAEKAPQLWRRLAGVLGGQIGLANRTGARLEFTAYHDPLTGLPNRTLFNERFEQAVARSRRGGPKCALLYLDLDSFKPVNDTHGHAMGDRLLALVADRIRSAAQPGDLVARYGGDEFVILLPSCGSSLKAGAAAASLLQEIGRPFAVGDLEFSISASAGIALCPDHGTDPETLMRHADMALYHAKKNGHGTYRVWSAT